MQKGWISSAEQIESYVEELKKTGRKLLTNYYLDAEKLQALIKERGISYDYKEGKYLNLLCREEGFLRLYFYIAAFDGFNVEESNEIVVCDLFSREENEELEKIMEKLDACYFHQYACFEKWRAKCPKQLLESASQEVAFGYEKDQEAINLIFEIFDKYTDYLPRKCDIAMFLKDKKFINIYAKEDDRLLGCLIYSQRGKEYTIEFYYVRPEERGKRISYLLHDHYYQKYAKNERGGKFVSWINTNNLKSILIHQRYNYQKLELKKYTYLRDANISLHK